MNEWIWIALYVGFFFLMMRYGCGAHMMGHHHSKDDPDSYHDISHDRSDSKFIDPVCGMPVPRDEGYGKMYKAVPYRFCSRTCLDRFDADPARYVSGHAEHAV